MSDTNVRSRRVGTNEPKSSNPVEEKEKMFLKNRKQSAENYEFGEIQKVPANVREIMDRNFYRLFVWELYFGMRDSACHCEKNAWVICPSGYIFWTIFFGIGPMVMFFPMVKLAIHGYEVLVLSLASPIILSVSLVNNIAEVCSTCWFFNLICPFFRLEHCRKTTDTCCGHSRSIIFSNPRSFVAFIDSFDWYIGCDDWSVHKS